MAQRHVKFIGKLFPGLVTPTPVWVRFDGALPFNFFENMLPPTRVEGEFIGYGGATFEFGENLYDLLLKEMAPASPMLYKMSRVFPMAWIVENVYEYEKLVGFENYNVEDMDIYDLKTQGGYQKYFILDETPVPLEAHYTDRDRWGFIQGNFRYMQGKKDGKRFIDVPNIPMNGMFTYSRTPFNTPTIQVQETDNSTYKMVDSRDVSYAAVPYYFLPANNQLIAPPHTHFNSSIENTEIENKDYIRPNNSSICFENTGTTEILRKTITNESRNIIRQYEDGTSTILKSMSVSKNTISFLSEGELDRWDAQQTPPLGCNDANDGSGNPEDVPPVEWCRKSGIFHQSRVILPTSNQPEFNELSGNSLDLLLELIPCTDCSSTEVLDACYVVRQFLSAFQSMPHYSTDQSDPQTRLSAANARSVITNQPGAWASWYEEAFNKAYANTERNYVLPKPTREMVETRLFFGDLNGATRRMHSGALIDYLMTLGNTDVLWPYLTYTTFESSGEAIDNLYYPFGNRVFQSTTNFGFLGHLLFKEFGPPASHSLLPRPYPLYSMNGLHPEDDAPGSYIFGTPPGGSPFYTWQVWQWIFETVGKSSIINFLSNTNNFRCDEGCPPSDISGEPEDKEWIVKAEPKVYTEISSTTMAVEDAYFNLHSIRNVKYKTYAKINFISTLINNITNEEISRDNKLEIPLSEYAVDYIDPQFTGVELADLEGLQLNIDNAQAAYETALDNFQDWLSNNPGNYSGWSETQKSQWENLRDATQNAKQDLNDATSIYQDAVFYYTITYEHVGVDEVHYYSLTKDREPFILESNLQDYSDNRLIYDDTFGQIKDPFNSLTTQFAGIVINGSRFCVDVFRGQDLPHPSIEGQFVQVLWGVGLIDDNLVVTKKVGEGAWEEAYNGDFDVLLPPTLINRKRKLKPRQHYRFLAYGYPHFVGSIELIDIDSVVEFNPLNSQTLATLQGELDQLQEYYDSLGSSSDKKEATEKAIEQLKEEIAKIEDAENMQDYKDRLENNEQFLEDNVVRYVINFREAGENESTKPIDDGEFFPLAFTMMPNFGKDLNNFYNNIRNMPYQARPDVDAFIIPDVVYGDNGEYYPDFDEPLVYHRHETDWVPQLRNSSTNEIDLTGFIEIYFFNNYDTKNGYLNYIRYVYVFHRPIDKDWDITFENYTKFDVGAQGFGKNQDIQLSIFEVSSINFLVDYPYDLYGQATSTNILAIYGEEQYEDYSKIDY